ncbi:MOSC domain-containing protein [Ammoniphilus sp. CFH 90114]|uniref:MOSC domain-containing protein n=1 Tax=Ammoniphilus sp. CFH 90114 TaxID=2493665 RepID=UPI00100FF47C|nr:MOSC domain-containing protein [Ammoniphilus sp. CFH 90114]RXT02758.1 MOSC domain-containing protein [Ammoniphilus sp. CFH 90114]
MKNLVGKLEAVLYTLDKESFVTSRVTSVQLDFGGIPGDRHFGITTKSDSRLPMYERGTEIQNRRQVSVVSLEECENVARELGVKEILPEWLGANLLISGIADLTKLRMGSRIMFPSGAVIICEGENPPCIHPGKVIEEKTQQVKIAPKFVKAAHQKRGIVCSVERPGEIYENDRVEVIY